MKVYLLFVKNSIKNLNKLHSFQNIIQTMPNHFILIPINCHFINGEFCLCFVLFIIAVFIPQCFNYSQQIKNIQIIGNTEMKEEKNDMKKKCLFRMWSLTRFHPQAITIAMSTSKVHIKNAPFRTVETHSLEWHVNGGLKSISHRHHII